MEQKNFYDGIENFLSLSSNLPWLSKGIYGNSLQSILTAVVAGVLISVVFVWLKNILSDRLRKIASHTENHWDDEFSEIVRRTKGYFAFTLGFYLAIQGLLVSQKFDRFIDYTFSICLFLQLFLWADRAILVFVTRNSKSNAERHGELTDPKDIILSFLVRSFVFATLILLLLSNLGVNVSALITGLGVGGIALALAVQKILGDLLASISIALDKPFTVGDSITIGTLSGTVEKIGLKTTRIRSVNGELLIVPNTDILTKSVQNFKELKERRVVLRFGIIYDTSEENVRLATDLVKYAIESIHNLRLERVHFFGFGPSSLDYEAIYWVLDTQYITLMDAQQAVNLKILALFKENKIIFAYPSQTVYLNQST